MFFNPNFGLLGRFFYLKASIHSRVAQVFFCVSKHDLRETPSRTGVRRELFCLEYSFINKFKIMLPLILLVGLFFSSLEDISKSINKFNTRRDHILIQSHPKARARIGLLSDKIGFGFRIVLVEPESWNGNWIALTSSDNLYCWLSHVHN